MPAKRRSGNSRRRVSKPKRNFWAYLFVFTILTVPLFIKSTTRIWNSGEKLTLLTIGEEGSATVIVFDPLVKKITSYYIPSDMQVRASRQFGTWKLGGLKILGKNEGLGDKLAAESVMYHFGFPIDAWATEKANGFVDGGFKALASLASPYKTNLGLGDKFSLFIFSSSVKTFDKEMVDILDFNAVERKVLIDGSSGSVLTGSLPRSVYAIFAEPDFSDSQTKIKMIDKTKSRRAPDILEKLFFTLGVKVASIVQENPDNSDCIVRGESIKKVKHMARLLDCSFEKGSVGSFDFEFIYGEDFLSRI